MLGICVAFLLAAGPIEKPVSLVQLKQALNAYQKISTLKVDFNQTKTLKEMGVSLQSSGTFTLSRGSAASGPSVVWEVRKPSPLKVTLNSQEMVLETPTQATPSTEQGKTDIQHFRLSEATQNNQTRNLAALTAWLSLDAKVLDETYHIYQTEPRGYQFLPKDSNTAPWKELRLKLNSKNHVESVSILENSGDQMTILFGKPIFQ